MKNLLKVVLASLLLGFSTLTFAGPVNINSADAVTLASNIKGVGVKKAEAIVAYREKHGRFGRIEGLQRVKGIGAKTVEKNRANLKVNDN